MILLPPLQAPAEQLPPVVLGCHGEPPPLLGRAGSGLPPAEKQPPQPPCREEGGLSCCDSPRPLTTPWLGRLLDQECPTLAILRLVDFSSKDSPVSSGGILGVDVYKS